MIDRNRRFAELVGCCGEHCRGNFCDMEELCPDFAADPRLVLREMIKRILSVKGISGVP